MITRAEEQRVAGAGLGRRGGVGEERLTPPPSSSRHTLAVYPYLGIFNLAA